MILRLRNEGTGPRAVMVSLGPAELGRVVVPPLGAGRFDLAVPRSQTPRPGDRFVLVGDGDDWALSELELANVHGFSSGVFSFVVTPRGAPVGVRPPPWLALVLLVGLMALSTHPFSIEPRAARYAYLSLRTIVTSFLVLTILLPLFSAYRVLLSLSAYSLCLSVLYGPLAVSYLVRQGKRTRDRMDARVRRGLGLAVCVCLILGYAWIVFSHNSFAVGGSDSSGYLSFARMLASGEASRKIEALDRFALDPERFQRVFIPLGWRESEVADRMVPVFPMGVPVQMLGLARLFGWETGPFLLSPLSSLAGIGLMYLLGRRLTLSRGEAMAATAILALWPVYLTFAVQPMSDLSSAIWFMAALLLTLGPSRSRAVGLGAGFAFGMAVMVRPANVVLVVPLVIGMWGRWHRLPWFLLGGLPCGVFFLGLNTLAYGHPLVTGNGFLMRYDFGPAFAVPNLRNFGYWLLVTLGPLAVAALALPLAAGVSARTRLLLVSWFGLNVGFYTFYKAGDAYWWTRYLLPGVPALIIAGIIVLRESLRAGVLALSSRRVAWLPRPPVLLTLVVVAILLTSVVQTGRLGVLDVADGESVYPEAVRWADSLVSPRSLIVSGQMGTAVIEYSEHVPVAWAPLRPKLFEELWRTTRSHGYAWYALLYPEETARLEEQTGATWEQVGRFRQVTLWQLVDEGEGSRAALPLFRTPVVALDQPPREGRRRDVLPSQVAVQAAEEGDPLTDEDREPGDDELVDQVLAQEALDGLAAVDVDAGPALPTQLLQQIARRKRRDGRLVAERLGDLGHRRAQHGQGPILVVPDTEPDDQLEGRPAHDDGVDVGEERGPAVVLVLRLVGAGEPVDAAVGTGDVAVEAGGAVDDGRRTFGHVTPLLVCRPRLPAA